MGVGSSEGKRSFPLRSIVHAGRNSMTKGEIGKRERTTLLLGGKSARRRYKNLFLGRKEAHPFSERKRTQATPSSGDSSSLKQTVVRRGGEKKLLAHPEEFLRESMSREHPRRTRRGTSMWGEETD